MTSASGQGLYANPAVYDILSTPGTAAEVDALERVERACCTDETLRRDRLWAEPACGTGRYLRVAVGRGRRVAGWDRDAGMIAYARGRLPRRARLLVAELAGHTGLPPGRVDFAFIPVNTLRILADDAQVLAHFRQVASLLRPGGLYVVGVSLTDYAWLQPEEDVWTGARGRCRVTQVVNYLPPEPGTPRARLERVLSHLTIERPRGSEHRDDAYDLRCYDRGQWDDLVARGPLEPAGSFDDHGRPLGRRRRPYQLEVLRRPERS